MKDDLKTPSEGEVVGPEREADQRADIGPDMGVRGCHYPDRRDGQRHLFCDQRGCRDMGGGRERMCDTQRIERPLHYRRHGFSLRASEIRYGESEDGSKGFRPEAQKFYRHFQGESNMACPVIEFSRQWDQVLALQDLRS